MTKVVHKTPNGDSVLPSISEQTRLAIQVRSLQVYQRQERHSSSSADVVLRANQRFTRSSLAFSAKTTQWLSQICFGEVYDVVLGIEIEIEIEIEGSE